MVPAADPLPGPRLALVVATATYTADLGLRQLRAPARDAADLAQVLADPRIGGFAVTTVIDQPAQQIRLAIEDFLDGRGTGDLLLVYLSCHGLLDARRRLYFAATDTRKDRLGSTGVEAAWILDQLEHCRARRQVLILDSCFSGAFAHRAKGEADLGLRDRFLGQGRGRVVLTASSATEYSFEGDPTDAAVPAGSVFTAALVQGLRTGEADTDHDGHVSVDDAYAYVFDQVQAAGAAQTPQRWLYGAEGRILLARNPAGPTIIPAPLPESLRAGLESPHPSIRIGAVNELGEWLTGGDPARAATAQRHLQEVAETDIPRVAAAARTLVGTRTTAEPPVPAVAPAPLPPSALVPPSDLTRERTSLSLKSTQEDPWQQFARTHQIGQIALGRVTKLVSSGAFVRVEEGIEGLVHISELADRHVEAPEQVVQVGDEIFVKIIDIDLDRRRISLSLKQANEGTPCGEAPGEFDPTLYGMPASYDEQGNYEYPEGFESEKGIWLPGYEKQREEWDHQYAEARARFEAHRRQVEKSRKAADNRTVTTSSTPGTSATGTPASNEGTIGEAVGDDFDPTLYGMPASYDEQGNYEYPEGFDSEAGEWLPGYEKQREEWMQQYAEARARFEAHRRQVEKSRKAADNRTVTTSSTPGTSARGSPASDEALAALHEKLSRGTVDHGSLGRTLTGHDGAVVGVAFRPDGQLLATASADKTARLWNPATGEHRRTLTGHDGPVNWVAFSPDGRLLATASADNTIRLWNPATGEHRRTLTGHDGLVYGVAFSPDGRLLATAGSDGTARLWNPATGEHRRTLTGHDGTVWGVAFSPDGRLLATASADNAIRLWNPATGEHRRTLTGHDGLVYGVAFSPDGRLLATASADNTIRLWNPATGEHQHTLTGHDGVVLGVAFSPDGRLLATASADNTIRLWNPATGEHQHTLTGHDGVVLGVAFSPDGQLLATAGHDGIVRLWG